MTELIWDGKYVDGRRQSPTRIALPFQTIETVNESTADRRRTLELFASGRPTEWRNRLIWGDKKYVLPSLLPEFSGKVDLVYIDPPFDTGADFSYTAAIPTFNEEDDSTSFRKQPSIIEQKAYRDTWGRGLDSYLGWLSETAVLLKELLSPNGNAFVHLGVNVSAYARPILSEVFGPDAYTNEIVWKRSSAHSDIGQGAMHLGRLHDVIYWYRASENSTVNMQYEPYSEEYLASAYKHIEPKTGRRYRIDNTSGPGGARKGNPFYEFHGVKKYWRYSPDTIERLYAEGRLIKTKEGGDWGYKRYLDEMPGVPIQDLWLDIPPLQSQSAEKLGYDTQKPEKLLERLVSLGSNAGDLVLDCFIGSGTTLAMSEKLGRRWIGCDLGRFAIHTTRKRLLSIPSVKPFMVQNLGKYERQAWQTDEFQAKGGDDRLEQQRQREAGYRKFILELYRATVVNGHTWLHGVKSGRMVHIGAVDAPVTIADVKAVAREVWKVASSGGAARKASADILGWEFAFELNETARQVAAESRVDVSFKKIPHEVLEKKAVEQGDIKFFELGALSVEPTLNNRELALKLTEFVIPRDDVPEDVWAEIKHWSQMVDYWAVDWDFKDDTFHNQWQSYRTRQAPKIELSTKYEYDKPGSYRVLVKVIDILGNDTTKTLDIKVK
jgi:DNA modification methylase